MRSLALSVAAAISALVIAACGSGKENESSQTAAASTSGQSAIPSGSVLFLALGNYASDLYTINADGTDPIQLADSVSDEILPQWSPDGKQIAFSSRNRDGEPFSDVFVVDADGRNERNLTNSKAWDVFDSWSPDGTRLLYNTDGYGRTDYWTIGVDGSDAARVAEDDWCSDLDWSPDGKRLVGCQCAIGNRGDCSLFTVDARGSDMKTIVGPHGGIYGPRWSPDGSRLLYIERTERASDRIFVVDIAGGEPREIYEGPIAFEVEQASPPVWSPDGRTIAVATGSQLLGISADGGNRSVVAADRAAYLAWSPDSTRIGISALRGDIAHLFVTIVSTGSSVEMSSGPIGWGLSWSPDGSRIVFPDNSKRQDGVYWLSPTDRGRGLVAPFVQGVGKTPEPQPSLQGGCRVREAGSRWECLSPDGNTIATTAPVLDANGRGFNRLALIDTSTNARTEISPPVIDIAYTRPAWSANGESFNSIPW